MDPVSKNKRQYNQVNHLKYWGQILDDNLLKVSIRA